MFEWLGSSDRSIFGDMTNQNDRFLHFFGYIHTHLCHDTDLRDTPWRTIDRRWWEDREWIDNDDSCSGSFDSGKNRIEIRFCEERYIRMTHAESERSSTDLSDMFLTRDIENWLVTTRTPFAHLESECRLPYSRFPWEKNKRSCRESTTKNRIEFSGRTRISLHALRDNTRVYSFCFEDFTISEFTFSFLNRRLMESIPLSTSWTLPGPFWRSCSTWWANEHISECYVSWFLISE